MSVVYDVEGIVIGNRAKLEKIAEQYLNDPEAKEMNYSLEAKIDKEGRLMFTGQGVGRNMTAPEVEKIIDKYLDDDVECYKLWGSTDGCWDQYTNDTKGKYYKQWYVDDFTHDAPKVFFDAFDKAKVYAMLIIKNNPQYIQGLNESGTNEEDYFDEVCLEYLVLNQAPVQIVDMIKPQGDVVDTDAMNEDLPGSKKGSYKDKYFNLTIPACFKGKKISVEGFWYDNLTYLDEYSVIAFISDSSTYMDWFPEFSGYLVRFVDKQDFEIGRGKSFGMIFKNIEDAKAKLALIGDLNIKKDEAETYYSNGYDYYYGLGVEKDLKLSAEYYEKAALMGHSNAQNNLGNAYYNGNGVQQDYDLAVKWYKKAAEQGNPNAQNNLGNAYYNGNGVQQDYDLAVKWYKKAAEQGDANALNNMGIAYFKGNGVQQDYELAAESFEKSADLNNSSAQRNLAMCYENGYGVEKNFAKAVKMYRLSARYGCESAKQWLNSHPEAEIYGDDGEIRIDISIQNDSNNYYFAHMTCESETVEILNRRFIFQKSIGLLRRLCGEGLRCNEVLFKNCFENNDYLDIAKELKKFPIKTLIPELKIFLDSKGVPYEEINMDDYDTVLSTDKFFAPKYYIALTQEEYKPKCLRIVSACIDYNLLRVFKREYIYRFGKPIYQMTESSMIESNPVLLKERLKVNDYEVMMQKLGDQFKGISAFDDIIAFLKENKIKYKLKSPSDWDSQYRNHFVLPKNWLDTHPEMK
jgi:TPR repeat protein